jgi:hypothetical protein
MLSHRLPEDLIIWNNVVRQQSGRHQDERNSKVLTSSMLVDSMLNNGHAALGSTDRTLIQTHTQIESSPGLNVALGVVWSVD